MTNKAIYTNKLTDPLLGLFEDLCDHGPFAEIFIDPENPEHYVNWLGDHKQER